MALINETMIGGVNAKDCTATSADILSGKTAAVGKEILKGTMANNGAVGTAISNGVLKKGYTDGGTIANLIAKNIRKGISICGIIGTYDPETEPGTTTVTPIGELTRYETYLLKVGSTFYLFGSANKNCCVSKSNDFKTFTTTGKPSGSDYPTVAGGSNSGVFCMGSNTSSSKYIRAYNGSSWVGKNTTQTGLSGLFVVGSSAYYMSSSTDKVYKMDSSGNETTIGNFYDTDENGNYINFIDRSVTNPKYFKINVVPVFAYPDEYSIIVYESNLSFTSYTKAFTIQVDTSGSSNIIKNYYPEAILKVGNILVAFIKSKFVCYSKDSGSTWTKVTTLGNTGKLMVDGDYFYFYDATKYAVYRSSNGSTWTKYKDLAIQQSSYTDVVVSDSIVYAVQEQSAYIFR